MNLKQVYAQGQSFQHRKSTNKLSLNIERKQGIDRNTDLVICSGHWKRQPKSSQQSSEAELEKAQLAHITYMPGTSLRLEMHDLI